MGPDRGLDVSQSGFYGEEAVTLLAVIVSNRAIGGSFP